MLGGIFGALIMPLFVLIERTPFPLPGPKNEAVAPFKTCMFSISSVTINSASEISPRRTPSIRRIGGPGLFLIVT